MSNRN